MDTSTPESVPRAWTVRELETELAQVRHEIRLIDHFMSQDPKPSEEDQALYAERMLFLAAALGQLPQAIKAVELQASLKRPGYVSMDVKF